MRAIKGIVVHGAWTKPGIDVDAEEIRSWHKDRGFSDIGYHYVIRRDGKLEDGRPIEKAGAHVKGHNTDTVGICLVGGRDDLAKHTRDLDEFTKQEVLWEFNYTAAQMATLRTLVAKLKAEHRITDVRGHRDFPGVTKRCPGFDVRAYFSADEGDQR